MLSQLVAVAGGLLTAVHRIPLIDWLQHLELKHQHPQICIYHFTSSSSSCISASLIFAGWTSALKLVRKCCVCRLLGLVLIWTCPTVRNGFSSKTDIQDWKPFVTLINQTHATKNFHLEQQTIPLNPGLAEDPMDELLARRVWLVPPRFGWSTSSCSLVWWPTNPLQLPNENPSVNHHNNVFEVMYTTVTTQ